MKIVLATGIFMMMISGCEKAIIGKHLDTNQREINSLEDAQALLDNMDIMGQMPSVGEISSDDFYVLDSTFNSLNSTEFNAYTWKREIYDGEKTVDDWNLPYQQIFYANSILNRLDHLQDEGSPAVKSRIKGSALFVRAFAYYQLSQIFVQTFDSISSGQPGLPIRLSPNPEIPSVRSRKRPMIV
jgi:hypothetical protein